jgi:dihydroneopterin aldolase
MIMGMIALKGMAFYSHHGYYTEERKRGNNYLVDVYIDYDLDEAGITDNLQKAINYEQVYKICQDEMEIPRHLIETVSRSIAQSIKMRFPEINHLTVKLKKLAPELGGKVESANVVYKL